MSKEFKKQLQDFYQDYRDENGIGWALCDAINVADLAKDTIKFLEKFKDQKISDLEEKLEEYKGRYLTTESYNTFMSNEIHKVVKENKELKQQLADMTEKYNACQEARKLEAEFNSQDKKQLRQQLAEWQDGTIVCKWTDAENRVKELEQQLAEKEQTIINLIEDSRASKELLNKQLVEKEKENELMTKTLKMTKFVEKEIDQDKILFALEQLEKVKEIINKNYFYNMSSDSCTFDKLEVDFQIDNQIASLKKGDKSNMKVYIVKEICDSEYFCREVVFATLNEETAKRYCEENSVKDTGWDRKVRDTVIYEEYELED